MTSSSAGRSVAHVSLAFLCSRDPQSVALLYDIRERGGVSYVFMQGVPLATVSAPDTCPPSSQSVARALALLGTLFLALSVGLESV